MRKSEILHNLQSAGLLNRFKNCQQWREAFLLYNAVNGSNLQMNCGRCFQKVKQWLTAD